MKSKDFYKTTAWKWFSKYVLLHYSNNGVVRCATCSTRKKCSDSKMHLGHLIKVFSIGSNTNFATAFDERNVMPQCYQCNVLLSGNELKMMDAINLKFGSDTYEELKAKARIPFKLDKYTLDDIALNYRLKFNELVKIKGNPWK